MQRFGDRLIYPSFIRAFIPLAICDEAVASRVVQMPFLDGTGFDAYFAANELLILEGLGRIAQSTRGAVEEVLSSPRTPERHH